MADITYQIKLIQSDGTDFSSVNEAGGAVQLQTSNVAGADIAHYADFAEVGYGLWEVLINEGDSGYYRVETQTTAVPAWAGVKGFTPIKINLEPFLPLRGGTLTGSVVMTDNSITDIDTLAFHDVLGTVAGIQNQYLLSRAANEEIDGAWDFDGACTVTAGSFNFTTDKCLINSIIVSPYVIVSYNKTLAANVKTANVNGTIWISDGAYEIVSIEEVHEIAEATAGTCYLQFERLLGAEAEGVGDDILTDNTNNGFSLKNAAKTIQTGDIHATNKVFADNERLGIVLSANGTELAGLHITIKLKRV